jgi:hypothetical protein
MGGNLPKPHPVRWTPGPYSPFATAGPGVPNRQAVRWLISEVAQPFKQRSLAFVPLDDPQPQPFHFRVFHLIDVSAGFLSPIVPVLRIL